MLSCRIAWVFGIKCLGAGYKRFALRSVTGGGVVGGDNFIQLTPSSGFHLTVEFFEVEGPRLQWSFCRGVNRRRRCRILLLRSIRRSEKGSAGDGYGATLTGRPTTFPRLAAFYDIAAKAPFLGKDGGRVA